MCLLPFSRGTLTPEMVSQLPIAQSLLARTAKSSNSPSSLEQNAPEVLEAARTVRRSCRCFAPQFVATAAVAGAVEVESPPMPTSQSTTRVGAVISLLLDITHTGWATGSFPKW